MPKNPKRRKRNPNWPPVTPEIFAQVLAEFFVLNDRFLEMHEGDDPIEVLHGHHCCKGDCWHHTLLKSGKPLAEVLKEKRAARNN